MIEFFQNLPHYPALFAECVLSGMFWPWPEDVPLLYAGMAIAAGKAEWAPTFGVGAIAVLLRDLLAFGMGRLLGDVILEKPWVIRFIGHKRLARARRMLANHGSGAILAGRFLVGMRAPVFFVAGTMGISVRRFLAWDTIGLMMVVPLTLWLGFTFGDPLLQAMLGVWQSTRYLGGLLVFVAMAWLFQRTWKKRRAAKAARTATGTLIPSDDDDDDTDEVPVASNAE